MHFHSRSVVQLYDYETNLNPPSFESWQHGEELFSTQNKNNNLLDRDFRPLAEESDQMDGMQVFTSMDDFWAGFTSSYLETLRDEYGKSSIWVWALPGVTVPPAEVVCKMPKSSSRLILNSCDRALAELG